MKRDDATLVVRESKAELQAGGSITHDPGRRALFGKSAAALAAGAGALATGKTMAQALEVPASNRQAGRPIPESEYGMPSKYEAHVKRRATERSRPST